MTETRICLRCGRNKALKAFRADPARPKRLVASKCLDCEAKSGQSAVRRPARSANHQRPVVACKWCGLTFTPDRSRKRYCQPSHRLLYESEEHRLRRWDREADLSERPA